MSDGVKSLDVELLQHLNTIQNNTKKIFMINLR